MFPKWQKLAGEMLELASEQFSNHGCNDWEWPDDWTPEERHNLAIEMVAHNIRKSVSGLTQHEMEEVNHWASGKFGPPDWWVMSFLADKLKGGE